MQKDGVPHAASSSDQEFLRRLHIDLTGRIPHDEESRAFLAFSDPDKRDKLVDQLVTSKPCGDGFDNDRVPMTITTGDRTATTGQLRECQALGRSCGPGCCQSRCVAEQPPWRLWTGCSRASARPLPVSAHSHAAASAAATSCASRQDHRLPLCVGRHRPQALFSAVLQDQRNGLS